MRQAWGSLKARDGTCGFQTVEESSLNFYFWQVFGYNYRCRFSFLDRFVGFSRFGSKTVKSIWAEESRVDLRMRKQSGVQHP